MDSHKNEVSADNSLEMATGIVAAYVGKNSVPAAELPALLQSVHSMLKTLAAGGVQPAAPEVKAASPAVPIKGSVQKDYIICLEDGMRFKSLKRHLSSKYNMSPDEYRAKWGLKSDYPMVAPSYSATRSQLAKSIGLGTIGNEKGSTRAAAE